jgi:hypothetical protein
LQRCDVQRQNAGPGRWEVERILDVPAKDKVMAGPFLFRVVLEKRVAPEDAFEVVVGRAVVVLLM